MDDQPIKVKKSNTIQIVLLILVLVALLLIIGVEFNVLPNNLAGEPMPESTQEDVVSSPVSSEVFTDMTNGSVDPLENINGLPSKQSADGMIDSDEIHPFYDWDVIVRLNKSLVAQSGYLAGAGQGFSFQIPIYFSSYTQGRYDTAHRSEYWFSNIRPNITGGWSVPPASLKILTRTTIENEYDQALNSETTGDVDMLLTPEGFDNEQQLLLGTAESEVECVTGAVQAKWCNIESVGTRRVLIKYIAFAQATLMMRHYVFYDGEVRIELAEGVWPIPESAEYTYVAQTIHGAYPEKRAIIDSIITSYSGDW